MLKTWRPYFLIFVIGFLLFYQTLFFDLTFLDDQALLLDNFNQLQSQGIKGVFLNDAFFSGTNIYYRPILNLSFWLEMQFNSPSYFIPHLFNILFHVVATCLVFLILQKFRVKKEIAFLGSLIFLVHPALTQAVAWIPGRNDSLLALFILASFLLLIRFLENGKIWEYSLHALFLLLALFTKETAVFAPFIFFAYLILIKREKVFALNSDLLYLSWGSTLFIYFLARSFVLENSPVLRLGELFLSLRENLAAFIIASGKVFFPFNLKVLPTISDSTLIYGWLTLIIVVALFIAYFKKNKRQALFGIIWFVIFLLPTLLLQSKELGVDFHLEHRIYLPIVGIFIFLVGFVNFDKKYWNRKMLALGLIVLIGALASLTFIHSQKFKNGITFWQSAVATSPNLPLAHRNLGVIYYFNDNDTAAVNEYQQALDLNPQEPMAHNNIGLIYLENNDLDVAEEEFNEELVINPGYSKALLNLGELYYRQKKFDQAQRMWQAALNVDPDNFEAQQHLLILQKQLR